MYLKIVETVHVELTRDDERAPFFWDVSAT